MERYTHQKQNTALHIHTQRPSEQIESWAIKASENVKHSNPVFYTYKEIKLQIKNRDFSEKNPNI